MSTTPAEPAASALVSVRYEAKTRPFRRFTTLYALAYFGAMLVRGGIISIILPLHVQQIEFANYFTGAGAAVPTADEARLLGLNAESLS